MARITASNAQKKRLITRIGELEYTSDDLFYFKNGICGFETLKNFIVTELPYRNTPDIYRYLQSVEAASLALIMMNVVVTPKSGIINAADLKTYLQARALELEDVDVFLVTSIHYEAGRQRVSVNTKAPIILAPGRQEGWQAILDNPTYQVKHYLV